MKTSLALLALAGSAAAFNAPMMSGAATRRDALAGAAGAAVVAPLLRPSAANAELEGVAAGKNFAPVITVFDHRPCQRPNKEYKGELTGTEDDKMLVMLKMQQIAVTDGTAQRVLQETIGLLPKNSRLSDYQ
eukprot:CAMPEP_0174923176 /NCGR_PEP_ID=MMETSP1355-20121228/6396_1 /TAXON_ID=464990 /ORGANISM="Hemiselmis tepida, Strain CCMP443" /LENGTH=131 /DNA_ID=CAMNT_0016168833 /DNA_START=37 /DNA_END=432 /DNA_ORIENTATION=+